MNKIKEFIVANWKKLAIAGAVLLACILLYSLGCASGCSIAKDKADIEVSE